MNVATNDETSPLHPIALIVSDEYTFIGVEYTVSAEQIGILPSLVYLILVAFVEESVTASAVVYVPLG